VDAGTGRIEAVELTGNETDDGSRVGPLLDQVAAPVASFTGDGAYDREDVSGVVAERHPEAAVDARARPPGPSASREPEWGIGASASIPLIRAPRSAASSAPVAVPTS
jgi:hypothetical protein